MSSIWITGYMQMKSRKHYSFILQNHDLCISRCVQMCSMHQKMCSTYQQMCSAHLFCKRIIGMVTMERTPRCRSGYGVRHESVRSQVRIPLAPRFFRGRVIPVTLKLALGYPAKIGSGYPARHLALQGQCWDWLVRCQYTVTGWGGKFDLQLPSQCDST